MWGQDPNPAGAIESAWGSGGADNWGGFTAPAFDSLLAAAAQIADPERKRVVWREALDLLNREAPAVWLLAPMQAAGVHNRLQDVVIRSDHWGATMWRWHVNADQMLPRDRIGIP